MPQTYGHEVGLLRTVIRGMEMRSIPARDVTKEFLRAEGKVFAHSVSDGVILLDHSAHTTFDRLAESLVVHSKGMERGVTFESAIAEILSWLANLIGGGSDSICSNTVKELQVHLEQWFARSTATRQMFIQCAISPWEAPRFSIGPVQFIFGKHVPNSEFYPSRNGDGVNLHSFNQLLASMAASHAHWLACVTVEGCDERRSEEIGALAVDLAITGLQLAFPLF